MREDDTHISRDIYNLTTGKPVTSLTPFASPLEEYRAAFEARQYPFLHYYTSDKGRVEKRSLTRGEFWDLACKAASHLGQLGISKGDRVVHCFSSNSLYDLVFRLASVLVGCVPVTINWQADDNEHICYKATVTDSKLLLYDRGFANQVRELKPNLLNILFLAAEEVEQYESDSRWRSPSLEYSDERIVVFTSGTTAKPRGASLSHRNFLASRLTFEHYFDMSESTGLDLLLVNPLHHANSTVLSDWGMRRSGAVIHLVERYSTLYWEILVAAASMKRDLLVTALVSRHIDFLESLFAESKLPVAEAKIKDALKQTDILIGSAPVGPKTIEHVLNFSQRLPHVRFGSTETCLEVMATPTTMSPDELMRAFEAGWSHHYQGEEMIGYYIGREHYPFTRVKVVKSVEPESDDYMRRCEIGEPGYLITQGANIMSYYLGDAKATESVFREGWYTGLKDIAFALRNKRDEQLDYYWMSRDSELLIRGGANYSYDQVAAELSRFLVERFHLEPTQFQLAVVGLRLESEHEDSCCVTIELSQEARHLESELKADFLEKAYKMVSKGSRPERVRFAVIPRNFKGAILYPQLKQDFRDSLGGKTLR